MSLNLQELPPNPMELFNSWYDQAKSNPSILDPNKMCISTINKEGFPELRWVLMKYHDLEKIRFFTNTKSAKASQIELNNKIGVNFIFRYEDYFRQIRITGYAETCDTKHADDYFATRSRGSQIGAWASNQSEKIHDRSTLDRQYNYYEDKFKDKTIPRPQHWSGYNIVPNKIEFWQSGKHRLHDRFVYERTLDQTSWVIYRISP